MTKVIIIGGNPAGLSAASRIKKYKPEWNIMVYEKGQYISYGGCGIPYYVEDVVKELDDLITLTYEDVTQKRNIPLKIFHEVIDVDFSEKKVKVKDLRNGEIFEDSYDYLFIETGAEPIIPERFSIQPGHPRLVKVHTLNDGKQIKDLLNKNSG